MAVLEKIRVKMGVFITVVIGLALLSFIIDADTFQSAVSVFSDKYDIGEMNGKSISYQDYQKKVEYFSRIHQIVSGAQTLDEQASDMVHQSAWQDLLSENVIMPVIEEAGIAVGEDELLDLTQGENISQVLAREQAFIGNDGMFDRNLLVQFIQAIPMDNTGNLSTYWRYLEKNMIADQMVSKYISLLAKSNIQNPVELRRAIEENNITSEVSFVVQPYSFAEDTTIAVTNSEVKEYYEKHKHLFERPASRDLEYAVFEVVPSLDDISAARKDIESLMPEFRTATNLRNFLARNSDKSLSEYYYKKGELLSESAKLDSFAFAASKNDVLEPYEEGDVFRAARINSIKNLPDSVYVQHILLQSTREEDNTADSLLNLISRGADFSELAARHSLDQNPNTPVPGDIGWMTQTRMIEGFDTCFTVTPGRAFKLESMYGVHIVNVKERTKSHKKVQLAVLEKAAVASRETFQKYYSQANELSSKANGNLEQFNEITSEMGVVTMPAYNIAENAKTVGGYDNAREIVRWAYDAKEGDVSQIISLDNKYFFVVALIEAREAGIPSMSEMTTDIARLLRREKANEKALAEITEQVAGLDNLQAIADKLGTTVSSQSGVAFGAPGARALDAKFVGAVSGAEENQLTGPIAGNVGVYVFNVDSRETGAFFTEDDARRKIQQALNFQLQYLTSIFEDIAEVKDNRARFF